MDCILNNHAVDERDGLLFISVLISVVPHVEHVRHRGVQPSFHDVMGGGIRFNTNRRVDIFRAVAGTAEVGVCTRNQGSIGGGKQERNTEERGAGSISVEEDRVGFPGCVLRAVNQFLICQSCSVDFNGFNGAGEGVAVLVVGSLQLAHESCSQSAHAVQEEVVRSGLGNSTAQCAVCKQLVSYAGLRLKSNGIEFSTVHPACTRILRVITVAQLEAKGISALIDMEMGVYLGGVADAEKRAHSCIGILVFYNYAGIVEAFQRIYQCGAKLYCICGAVDRDILS